MKTAKILALLSAGFLISTQLHAIPAWSRGSGASCSSCHATPTWQLNSTGLKFLAAGHRSEVTKFDAADVKLDHYISLVWKGRAYWDGLDHTRTGNANTQKPSTNFEQHSFSLYSGGPIADRFSYFTELYLSENTGNTSGANVVQSDAGRKKLAEAFIQYNHPLYKKAYLAARAGEILPGILHVYGVGARSAEQRAIVLNDALAGSPNNYRPFSRQQGVDLTLVDEHFELAAGLVDGSDTSVTNSIDSDSHKDFYLSANFSFDENESGFGLFHYNGNYSVYTTRNDFSTALLYKDPFTRTGLLGRFIRDSWRVVGAYFRGDEHYDVLGSKATNAGFYALIDYNFNDTYGMFARYDQVDPNISISRNEVKMVMLGFNSMLYQSANSGARFSLELTRKESFSGASIIASGTTKYTDNRVLTQITWGF